MTEKMLQGRYEGVELIHVPMNFSREMDEVGRPGVRKVIELVRVLGSIVQARLRSGAEVLWYPPAGPDRVPVTRDLVLLIATRWLFKKTIFHFHAGGVSRFYERAPRFARLLLRAAYDRPDVAIRIANQAPEDGRCFHARHEFVVSNGVEDVGGPVPAIAVGHASNSGRADAPSILYVGAVRRSKGILTLIEASHLLTERGIPHRVEIMGRFVSPAFEAECREMVRRWRLEARVRFLGVQTGAQKAATFSSSDIFCFPSFYESETFGVVLIEAMSHALPIVATRWRGIPDVVGEEGRCAFLVPVRAAEGLAEQLERLCRSPELRRAMGARARARYLERFTIESFRKQMQKVFDVVG